MFVPMLSMALSSLVYGDSAAKVEVGPGDGANGLVQCSATLFPNVSCAETAHNCVPRCSPYKNCSCGFTDLKKHPDGPCPPRNPDLRNGYPWACNVSSVVTPGTFTTCDLGGPHPLSTTKKNVLMIGDSVSNGYFQEGLAGKNVPDLIKDIAYSQHAPFSPGSGGAGPTSTGVDCLEVWLRLADGTPAQYDAISFNFGLHDLGNKSSDLATYKAQLTAITTRLVQTGSKVIYLDTTPMMPGCCNGGPLIPSVEGAPPPMCKLGAKAVYKCDTVVLELNLIAKAIMADHNIPYIDLHKTVTDICAPNPPHNYVNCSLCRMEPCSFHYNPAGYGPIAAAVATAFRSAL